MAVRRCPITLPNLLTLLLLLLLAAVWLRPFADLDFAWQVRTGGQIVETGSLRVEDNLTYTIAGKQLPDFEWLYEVLLWCAWSIAGYGGLHLLKVLCVITPLVVVAWRLRREGVGWHAVYLSLVVAILVLIPTWNLRPFYITTIALLLLSGWLHDHCTGRRLLSWEVPLLMLLWGNAHPGVITGQGLLVGAIAWEWLNHWLRLNPPLSRAACWRLTIFGGLGLIASLICPDPVERLRYTFNPDLAHPIMRGFIEMMPLHWHALRPPYLAGLVYVVALLVLWTVVRRIRVYRLWEIALLAGVSLLACYAFRSVQDCLLVMLAVGVPHLVALYRQAAPRSIPASLWSVERSLKRTLTASCFRFQRSWAVGLVLVLAVVSLSLGNLLRSQHGKDWPSAAVDFIEREDLRGNFFSNPNHGAYLLWRLGPDRAHCYVDTRGFFFPPELLEDSTYIPHLAEDWSQRLQGVLDRRTDYLLLASSGPEGALWRKLEGTVKPFYLDDAVVLLWAKDVRDSLAASGSARSSSQLADSPLP
jgi:hypothetical protein